MFALIKNKASSKNALKDLEDDDEDGVLDEYDEEERKKSTKGRKNAGRKSPWSQQQLNDFVDIIVENEEYKQKLIFRNTKFQRNGELYERIKSELEERCAARDFSFSANNFSERASRMALA